MATYLEQCIEVNMNNIAIKILQGCVVTQTVVGGLISDSASGKKKSDVWIMDSAEFMHG